MPIPNMYNLSQWNWMADRVGEGYPLSEIARFVGLSNKTVLKNLARIGRHIPESQRAPLDSLKKEFNDLFYDDSPDVCPPGKSVLRVDEDGNTKTYKTLSEAAIDIGSSTGRISAAVKNQTKCRGYRFFLNDISEEKLNED